MEKLEQKKLLEDIRNWLSKKENSSIKFANALGYKSGSTISRWLKRGFVPDYEINHIIRLIRQ